MNFGNITLALCLFIIGVVSGEYNHQYEDNDEVILWLNTVGPYRNPQETYYLFIMPICLGPSFIKRPQETIGGTLQGVYLTPSDLEIEFKGNVTKNIRCYYQLNDFQFEWLKNAIENNYWYQMYIDDLPVWGAVGEMEESNGEIGYYVWQHRKFIISYNGKNIVDVNIKSEQKVKVETGSSIPFSNEVIWKYSPIKFEDRFNKYLDPNFFQHKIHWFSIFNSLVMVVFFCGLVVLILMRVLNKEYMKLNLENGFIYMKETLGNENEYGWKQLHGDVFRPATNPMLFSAMIGAGTQIAVITLTVIVLAIMGKLYQDKAGSVLSLAIYLYAATSTLNGYISGHMYLEFGGKSWFRHTLLSAFFLPAPIYSVAVGLDTIGMFYYTSLSRLIPFYTGCAMTALLFFLILPLTIVGSLLARYFSDKPEQTFNDERRPIPTKKWFFSTTLMVLLAGTLPFGSIFIELYFIFASFTTYKIYYVYGFLLLAFFILMLASLCVSVVCTYLVLNAEDYRWQWISFMSAASASIYVFIYATYFFFFKTNMYGLYQTAFYFGYMSLFSLGLGIMCGAVAYVGTSLFVQTIYSYRNPKNSYIKDSNIVNLNYTILAPDSLKPKSEFLPNKN